MKLTHFCPTCSTVNYVENDDGTATDSITELLVIPLHDSAIYEVTCPEGHISRIILQNQRYELLFQSGVHALLDGYYREAVSSMAVAVECFYEYSIRVLSAPFLDGVEKENFDKTWKAISKQSERQVGAFYMLFLCVFQQPPILFDAKFLNRHELRLGIEGNDPIKFRNLVIHQGYLPSYNQAIVFGEAVNFYVREVYNLYKENDKLDVLAPTFEDVRLANSSLGQLAETSVLHTYSFISHMRMGPSMVKASLIDYINWMRENTQKTK